MTNLPEEIEHALATLPAEQQPEPALEDRVFRAVYAARRARRRSWRWAVAAAGVAAVLVVFLAHPWSQPRAVGKEYALLFTEPPGFQRVTPFDSVSRVREYARWADSLDALGKLKLEGRLEPAGAVDGLFIIRAADDAEAARIAATCPHLKYGGHVEVKRLIE